MLPVFIKGIAEAPISPCNSRSLVWKRPQTGWGRALPCMWVGGHGAGAPLALGSLLGCSRLEAPACHLGTQLLAGSDGGWGREVPCPPHRHPFTSTFCRKRHLPKGGQGSRGQPSCLLAQLRAWQKCQQAQNCLKALKNLSSACWHPSLARHGCSVPCVPPVLVAQGLASPGATRKGLSRLCGGGTFSLVLPFFLGLDLLPLLYPSSCFPRPVRCH